RADQIPAPDVQQLAAGGQHMCPVAEQARAEFGVAVALRLQPPGGEIESRDLAAPGRLAIDRQRARPRLADRAQRQIALVVPDLLTRLGVASGDLPALAGHHGGAMRDRQDRLGARRPPQLPQLPWWLLGLG